MAWRVRVVLGALAVAALGAPARSEHATNADVYMNTDILEAMSLSGLFNDSKTFVDSPMRASPDDVLQAFRELPNTHPDTIAAFYEQYFEDPGQELERWEPPDLHTPSFVSRIRFDSSGAIARNLVQMWGDLGRKVKSGVAEHPEKHSLLYVPNGFIIPGGRFREFYYWDTLWIVRGLLVCDMPTTALGMIDNLLYLVKQFGFVPNGGRVYYTNRSQPPVLPVMVAALVNYTLGYGQGMLVDSQDVVNRPESQRVIDVNSYLLETLPVLEREYDFFRVNRSVQITNRGVTHTLNQYRTNFAQPRPESFAEDVATAANVPEAMRAQLHRDIAAAAESGWDFSSRWFEDFRSINLTATSSVVPVCLNSILLRAERELEFLFRTVGNSSRAEYFRERAMERSEAMNALLWNERTLHWHDLHAHSKSHRVAETSASDFMPLWAWLVPPPPFGPGDVVRSFQESALVQRAGIATTTTNTGQQWDSPNAFPPLQDMLIEAIAPHNPQLALELSSQWVVTNQQYFIKTGQMAEKYNAFHVGEAGGGGEYEVQTGFGWSNGVLLRLLQDYVYADEASRLPAWAYPVASIAFAFALVLYCYVGREHQSERARGDGDAADPLMELLKR